MATIIKLADHRPPDEPKTKVAQITVYGDGETTLWLSDSIEYAVQFNWLTAKIAEATSAILRDKSDRDGEPNA